MNLSPLVGVCGSPVCQNRIDCCSWEKKGVTSGISLFSKSGRFAHAQNFVGNLYGNSWGMKNFVCGEGMMEGIVS